MYATDRILNLRPKAFNAVGVDVTFNKLTFTVCNCLVIVTASFE